MSANHRKHLRLAIPGVAESKYEMPKLPLFFLIPLRLTHFVLEPTAYYVNALAIR